MEPRTLVIRSAADRALAHSRHGLWPVLLLALLLVALAMTLSRAALAAERHSISGDRIAIYNLAGTIEVTAGSGPDVIVELSRGGRDGARLRVETGSIRGRSTLRVIYPGGHVVYPRAQGGSSRIGVNSDGTFGDRGSGWLSHPVTVSSAGGGTEAWADLRILVPAGRTLEVRLGVGEMTAQGLECSLLLDSHSGPVHAHRIRGPLSVDTGSGSVDVGDIEGDLSVDTGSGGVGMENVRGQHVSIDTGSGEVEGRGVKAQELKVDTGSGHVSLEDVRAPRVHVDTGSGGVLLGLAEDVEDVLIDTGSGGVTMRVPEALGAELDVDAGSGGVDSEIPLNSIHRDDGELRGRIGDGRGRILIDTGSGGVKLIKG